LNTILMTLLQIIPKCVLKLYSEAMKVVLIFPDKSWHKNFSLTCSKTALRDNLQRVLLFKAWVLPFGSKKTTPEMKITELRVNLMIQFQIMPPHFWHYGPFFEILRKGLYICSFAIPLHDFGWLLKNAPR